MERRLSAVAKGGEKDHNILRGRRGGHQLITFVRGDKGGELVNGKKDGGKSWKTIGAGGFFLGVEKDTFRGDSLSGEGKRTTNVQLMLHSPAQGSTIRNRWFKGHQGKKREGSHSMVKKKASKVDRRLSRKNKK